MGHRGAYIDDGDEVNCLGGSCDPLDMCSPVVGVGVPSCADGDDCGWYDLDTGDTGDGKPPVGPGFPICSTAAAGAGLPLLSLLVPLLLLRRWGRAR